MQDNLANHFFCLINPQEVVASFANCVGAEDNTHSPIFSLSQATHINQPSFFRASSTSRTTERKQAMGGGEGGGVGELQPNLSQECHRVKSPRGGHKASGDQKMLCLPYSMGNRAFSPPHLVAKCQ